MNKNDEGAKKVMTAGLIIMMVGLIIIILSVVLMIGLAVVGFYG